MLLVFVVSLLGFLAIGIPVGFSLALTSTVMLLFMNNTNFIVISQNLLSGTDNFALMAIPFFILAGEIMNEGGLSLGIVRFVKSLLGHVKGGLGYVAVVASMIFAGVSGAAVADTSAIGSVLLPLMDQEGYKKDKSTALICASGCVGPIIPPSIPMVVFGVVGGVSVTRMFLGGMVPGIVTGLLLMITWYLLSKKENLPTFPKASFKEVLSSTKDALPSLMLPFIILGGILSGIFTPTEAGVIAVVYAFVISVIIYKKLSYPQIRDIFVKAARSTSVVMFVVAAATAVAYVITVAQIPRLLGDLLMATTSNKYIILFLINILILLVGCFMDVSPSLLILGPILLPIVTKIGIDPVFFGVIMVYGLCIGLITPPVGNVLYVGCGLSKISIAQLVKKIWPLVVVYIIVLFLITYIPDLVMFIPNAVMK
ncbi:TRAP transporter large permease [Petroclostridium sp. X23]|uniref:TRAP transporter large permease n=1 Tax=Petroclostridium sp. X23 TaxID=3045146 RepID=UPI0024ADE776|nr:TRAP transporter large permease [Petroclostridium sp. X23]WHH57684.1 TRAP transporter large permease [Petroclostridium sp. X23]